ncbi:Ankyrin repeat protein 1 [Giardia muris]|uniref:Ankyrin repeat protein 1 n=1 Tax=Giardia muris TaxID=5742 RepID=A0A4Z1T5E6_GIAMU|nr:Ankyrin repeat protein 1 [Giardia muris]|eukprot:TNJ27691.1 Ankyrin repeat protein 1 [Giardia muris]
MNEVWFAAARAGDLDTISQLVGRHAATVDAAGETALMAAVRGGHSAVVARLAPHEQGLRNPDGYTALMLAAILNDAEACDILAPAEWALLLPDGRDALILAAQRGNACALTELARVASPLRDATGRTALDYAIEADDLPCVRTLYEAGHVDDVDAAIRRAAEHDFGSIIEYLLNCKLHPRLGPSDSKIRDLERAVESLQLCVSEHLGAGRSRLTASSSNKDLEELKRENASLRQRLASVGKTEPPMVRTTEVTGDYLRDELRTALQLVEREGRKVKDLERLVQERDAQILRLKVAHSQDFLQAMHASDIGGESLTLSSKSSRPASAKKAIVKFTRPRSRPSSAKRGHATDSDVASESADSDLLSQKSEKPRKLWRRGGSAHAVAPVAPVVPAIRRDPIQLELLQISTAEHDALLRQLDERDAELAVLRTRGEGPAIDECIQAHPLGVDECSLTTIRMGEINERMLTLATGGVDGALDFLLEALRRQTTQVGNPYVGVLSRLLQACISADSDADATERDVNSLSEGVLLEDPSLSIRDFADCYARNSLFACLPELFRRFIESACAFGKQQELRLERADAEVNVLKSELAIMTASQALAVDYHPAEPGTAAKDATEGLLLSPQDSFTELSVTNSILNSTAASTQKRLGDTDSSPPRVSSSKFHVTFADLSANDTPTERSRPKVSDSANTLLGGDSLHRPLMIADIRSPPQTPPQTSPTGTVSSVDIFSPPRPPAYTPLMRAIISGNLRAIGTNLKYAGEALSDGTTALMLAAEHNRTVAVKYLAPTEAGMERADGKTALDIALDFEHLEVADALTAEAIDVSSFSNEDGRTTELMLAARDDQLKLAWCLIPIQTRLRDAEGRTALIHAIMSQNPRMVRLLAPHEADLTDTTGRTPRDYVRSAGVGEIVRAHMEAALARHTGPTV